MGSVEIASRSHGEAIAGTAEVRIGSKDTLCHLRGSGTIDQTRSDMHSKVELPRAFSVRDEHEFLPIQHLMGRLNPQFVVKQIATGVHVDGGSTVFWGLVYLQSEPPSKLKVEKALREAGFDFAHNVLTQAALVLTDHS